MPPYTRGEEAGHTLYKCMLNGGHIPDIYCVWFYPWLASVAGYYTLSHLLLILKVKMLVLDAAVCYHMMSTRKLQNLLRNLIEEPRLSFFCMSFTHTQLVHSGSK